MRVYTSRFHNKQLRDRPDLVKVAITVGKPRGPVGFEFVEFNWLAPYGRLFRIDDRGEFTVAYFQKLDRIGVAAIRKRLQEISAQHGGKDLVLLCYENLKGGGVVPSASIQSLLDATNWGNSRGVGNSPWT